MVQISLPLPETLLQMTWFLIGFFAGRGGAKTDNIIKESNWYKGLCGWQQKILNGILDFTHHFWMGMLLMTYALSPEMYWFGMGLFIDDLPDIPARFVKWFGYLANKLHR